ncbi:MAG: NAD(P)-dependent oxidoreductase [Candidatus Bathyarchaeia archaeon]|jgi:3-hydroxyisobutyrate dehydrogenase
MNSVKKGARVGFIGLGIMGKPMASNLIRKGYTLTVFNRSKKPVDELASIGASAADSPKEVAGKSDIILDIVTDAPDVEQVLFGQGGVVEGAHRGTIMIDMSTNSPAAARSFSSKLEEKGIEFLDAPVSGGDKGAKEGTLTIMVGGKKEVLDKSLPVLQAIGKEIFYMGPPGSGQATKLCNQVAIALHTLATSESLLLGSAAGLDLSNLLKVMTSGAASSWNLTNLGPKIVTRDFEPGFKAAHLLKDLRNILRLAEEENLMLPGAALIHELYLAVMAKKEGEKGTQVLARVLERLAEREINSTKTS